MSSRFVDYGAFFETAARHPPYPYQRALAEAPALPARLEIPTGLGKTEAVLGAWIWRRRYAAPEIRARTPRRLVYCLPMRVLVSQTESAATDMLKRLGIDDVAVMVLMGGEGEAPESRPWDIYPERDAIIIGTQDMLLSRALHRGYAMSRFRWTIPFGLLNNDCFWVVDEPQLFGAGLPTTAQLHAFRVRRFGAFGPTGTLWMSATLDPSWLETVDARRDDLEAVAALTPADLLEPRVAAIRDASKRLDRVQVKAEKPGELARLIAEAHRPETLTLVIMNTVARAREIWNELESRYAPPKTRRGKQALESSREAGRPKLVLLHSQFRPDDRRAAEAAALAPPPADGTIVVSTQVVEAGVDISAHTLFTDLAPWASLVQRFGRCNRRGESTAGRIYWIARQGKGDKDALPYSVDGLATGQRGIEKLAGDASPRSIADAAVRLGPQPLSHVVRARDLLDLFDTTPDLSGADIDVSRFIRDTTDRDVHVYWRDVDADPTGERDPATAELCPAPIGAVREWLKARKGWRWDLVEGAWSPARAEQVYPGMEILLRARDGGYSTRAGWDPKCPDPVAPLTGSDARQDRQESDDPLSERRRAFQTLTEHSGEVSRLARHIAESAAIDAPLRATLERAGRYHDAGKAHPVFQRTMAGPDGGPWAKSSANGRHERRGFRHELASALLALENGESDLLAYLVASHHGKVRMRIRANPNEKKPPLPEQLFAKGIFDGERLEAIDLGDGLLVPPTTLSLEYMKMGDAPSGKESWTARVLRLRDSDALGPFRLAYLEALLRAADERASAGESTATGVPQ